jgi:hypothetical protein
VFRVKGLNLKQLFDSSVRTVISYIALFILLVACDPCRDCGPVVYEPTVELIFKDAEIVVNADLEEEMEVTTATDVSIFWEEVAAQVPFEEGTEAFVTPLSNQSDGSSYTVDIEGVPYQLSLSFEVYRELDVDHRMLVRARGIEAVSHSFDSLVFTCNTVDCLDKETTITCYF